MRKHKKTALNILLILFVLSFFVTPIGYHGKVFLNQLFSFAPDIIAVSEREQIRTYDWKLKDDQWNYFNFERSKGKVVFINFWASWRLPCAAELKGIQKLYDAYNEKVDFYIITDEERAPVETFMEKNKFTFPVTYLIIGEKTPVETADPPRTYILDAKGQIVVDKVGIADWDSNTVRKLLNGLLKE